MISIAIVGPGAIGSTVAAWLAQDDRFEITICARSPRPIIEVDSPSGPITASLPVLTDPALARPVDWVLFAVKAYDVEEASKWLSGLLTARTRVAVLQNGVEQVERLLPYVDAENIVPVVVDIPAERCSGGRIRQSKPGTLVVPDGPNGQEFVDLFANTPIDVSLTDDFVTIAWTKLALNAAGAIGAVLGQPSGIAHQEPIADLIRTVVAETVRVGRAEGAVLGDDLPDRVVSRMQTNPPLFVNSLQADRMAGRPVEADARNGVVVRRGAVHGIPTPANSVLVALLASSPVKGFENDSPRADTSESPGEKA